MYNYVNIIQTTVILSGSEEKNWKKNKQHCDLPLAYIKN